MGELMDSDCLDTEIRSCLFEFLVFALGVVIGGTLCARAWWQPVTCCADVG